MKRIRPSALTLVEIVVIAAVTRLYAMPLLDFRVDTVPFGREYASSIHAFHFWTRLRDCLACALWNGSIRGGYPALAELHAGILHPIAAVLVLLLGVPVGLKVAVAAALWSAGLAQWWIARSLKLGMAARIWSGCMAVVAGNLAGRMEAGMVNLVLSGGACLLALAAAIHLALRPSRRRSVLFGLFLAAALLSGQVYLQVGTLAALPLLAILAAPERLRRLGAGLAVAGGLALHLTAPLWLPVMRFMPVLDKPRDVPLLSPQPFRWVPLNLLIDDTYVYYTRTMGMIEAPSLYHNYIGWLPVVLALISVGAAISGTSRARRRCRFLLAGALWMLFLGSREPWRLLQQIGGSGPLGHWVSGFRNPSVIAGLAVPFVLGLAAMGVDRVTRGSVKRRRAQRKERTATATLLMLVTIVLMVTGLFDVATFNRHWLKTVPWPANLDDVLTFLRTPGSQWISTPYAEDLYTEPAIRAGMKLADAWQPWSWKDRDAPRALLFVRRLDDLEGMPLQPLATFQRGDFHYLSQDPRQSGYAVLSRPDAEPMVCEATAFGGDIDVSCPEGQGGLLTVQEHDWPGWKARVDGRSTGIEAADWLQVQLPPGGHGKVQLRYRPWDVGLGLILALLGALWTIHLVSVERTRGAS